jgi:hypothetical protein
MEALEVGQNVYGMGMRDGLAEWSDGSELNNTDSTSQTRRILIF